MSSFAEQYGIRLQSATIHTMKWDEFKSLLAGIGPETALGRIVSIRSEDDKDMLKHFSPEMKRIRSKWRSRIASSKPAEQTEAYLEALKQSFIKMAGEGR